MQVDVSTIPSLVVGLSWVADTSVLNKGTRHHFTTDNTMSKTVMTN